MQECVGLYGHPPPRLVDSADGVPRQFSPTIPGSCVLEATPAGSLAGMVMSAPPGTSERRYNLAAMLRALAPGACFTVLGPKIMGGTRLSGELAGFGCAVETTAKAHHRICRGRRPEHLDEAALAAAFDAGGPRRIEALGLWSQPGVFSWDRLDAGTELLLGSLPRQGGRGADLGCGIGMLARTILASGDVTRLDLLDIDRRAVEAAQRNVDDPRVRFAWRDVTTATDLETRDFVVMNPPFHASGREDKGLGQQFIRRAASVLRPGGELWLVANRHLPYEADLAARFRRVTPHKAAQGFKILAAVK